MAYLAPYSNLTSLLALPSYFSFSDTCCILPHIFPHISLPLATNNSSLPILSSSTFLYVQLLAHYDVIALSLFSIPHLLVCIPCPLLTSNLLPTATLLSLLPLSLLSSFLLLLLLPLCLYPWPFLSFLVYLLWVLLLLPHVNYATNSP